MFGCICHNRAERLTLEVRIVMVSFNYRRKVFLLLHCQRNNREDQEEERWDELPMKSKLIIFTLTASISRDVGVP
jgi:hypothetical protein